MMKKQKAVYITYQKDGYGGFEIDKVFEFKSSALTWVIEESFMHNSMYKYYSQCELEEAAEKYIEIQNLN